MSTNVLITGASGFLGSFVCRRLSEHPDYVLYCTYREKSNLSRLADVRNRINLVKLVRPQNVATDILETGLTRIDAIVHCATNYGRGIDDPQEQIEANLTLPLQLLQYGARVGLRAFVNTDTILDKGVNYYSLSKRQFVEWLTFFADRYSCANIAIEHFYGPGDDETKFVTWLVRRFLLGTPEVHLTEGQQRRDFIYVSDVVEAFVLVIRAALEANRRFVHYEVGSGLNISIRHFVELVQSLCSGTSTRPVFGSIPYRKNEQMEVVINLEPLRSLGWQPRVGLVEGLKLTVDHERRCLG